MSSIIGSIIGEYIRYVIDCALIPIWLSSPNGRYDMHWTERHPRATILYRKVKVYCITSKQIILIIMIVAFVSLRSLGWRVINV